MSEETKDFWVDRWEGRSKNLCNHCIPYQSLWVLFSAQKITNHRLSSNHKLSRDERNPKSYPI